MSRSLTKQIEHWASLGRRLESSGLFSHRQVLGFLRGSLDYDQLSALEQAVASEALLEELVEFEPGQDFFEEIPAGIGYSALDESGRLERHKE